MIDFAVSEPDFLAWAAQQDWKVESIVGGITVWPRSGFGDRTTEVDITDGWSYYTYGRGARNTFGIVYDRATQRAYYNFCSSARGDD